MSNSPQLMIERAKQRGVSLIEVLITLVVLMFGLLPLGALLARTHRAEFESYERKQVIVLLENMVDRINANRNAASCYAITATGTSGSPYLGNGSAIVTSGVCAAGVGIPIIPSSDEAARANSDLGDWNNGLQGTSEVSGTNNVGGALKARGCITNDGAVGGDPKIIQYTVSIAWQGTTDLPLPTSASPCAKGSYGTADTLRRVMSLVVRVPNLN